MTRSSRHIRIVCVVDGDVEGQVRSGRPRGSRASYALGIYRALSSIYHRVDLVGIDHHDALEQASAIARSKAHVIFNALSAQPLESALVGALELTGTPFTGSGVRGTILSRDKVRSRELLDRAGIRVPRFTVLEPGATGSVLGLQPPLIVKPVRMMSSFGVYRDSVVFTRPDAIRCAARIWKQFGQAAVCDEFIVGREVRVGVIVRRHEACRLVGFSEWTFPEAGWGFKDERVRTTPAVRARRGIKVFAPRLSSKRRSEILNIATAATRTLDIHGYATLDLRINALDVVHVIEVNSNPGLSATSEIWGGTSFDRNIRAIVAQALDSGD